MIFGQLASAATLFAKFHAGTIQSQSDFWASLLEQPIKFVLVLVGSYLIHPMLPFGTIS